MTAVKHLLNPDDGSDIYSMHQPPLIWEDSSYYEDFDPVFDTQTWDRLISEVIPPGEISDTLLDPELSSQSFREIQAQIEEWAVGDFPQASIHLETQPQEAYICYGMIYRTAVQLRGSMAELIERLSLPSASPIKGHIMLGLKVIEKSYFIIFDDGHVMGQVNEQMQLALSSMADQQYDIEFEVFAPIQATRETISLSKKGKDAVVRVLVNVYGPKLSAKSVGCEFSRRKVWLQRPDYMRDGAAYDNPHELKLNGFDLPSLDTTILVGDDSVARTKDPSLKEAMVSVYSSLTRDKNLKGLEADERLKTELLPHQKTALDFMTQRENGPIPEEYCLWKATEIDGQQWYRHAVASDKRLVEPPKETGGGILADEMGMGKSLSVLALVLRTLSLAHEWVEDTNQAATRVSSSWKGRRRSSATLIVASSDLMINEWFLELEKHFGLDSLKALTTIKYHGQNRATDQNLICNADIIITTYHTLASEEKSKDVLDDIEWYRLVLDEAHIIRRQATRLYQTVARLPARSRWCLTGTPIQNRLEDMGSLLAFLRIQPLHSMSEFRRYIASPFDEGGRRRTLAVERFTKLLDCICLRRTKDLLHLPDQENIIREIQLSPAERNQYEQTRKTIFRAMKHQNGVLDQKSTLGMFQVQLQLRILCNHGTWQQPFSWNRRKLHLLDEREFVEASLGREGEATCSVCRQTMPLFGTGFSFQRYEECRHVLCSECVEESMPQGVECLPTKCRLCNPLWNASKGIFKSRHISQEDLYFRPNGMSTKMDALISDVMYNVWHTKSIIFTCWTRTLDLISMYLKGSGLDTQHFERIDGDCPTSKREKILDEFAKNPKIRVLIMTTGTGAVGLNLATANRVFIVEPQWNPSVENQAVARALRLGQKQAVLVIRYVVNQTVEKDMRELQDRKMERANLVKSG